MDEVQKVLIGAGRKDLAKEYYKKVAVDVSAESFTGYEKLKQKFNHNNVRINTYEVEQEGNDFDGFSAEIEGTLSNGLEFSYEHDEKGNGEFKIRTKNRTEIYKKEFDLQKMAIGYSHVLSSFLKSTLNFDF